VRNHDIRRHYIAVACRLQPRSDTAISVRSIELNISTRYCKFIGHTEDSLIECDMSVRTTLKITFTFKINKAYKRFTRSFQSNNWRCLQFKVIHYTMFNYISQLTTLLSEQLPYDNHNIFVSSSY